MNKEIKERFTKTDNIILELIDYIEELQEKVNILEDLEKRIKFIEEHAGVDAHVLRKKGIF